MSKCLIFCLKFRLLSKICLKNRYFLFDFIILLNFLRFTLKIQVKLLIKVIISFLIFFELFIFRFILRWVWFLRYILNEKNAECVLFTYFRCTWRKKACFTSLIYICFWFVKITDLYEGFSTNIYKQFSSSDFFEKNGFGGNA